MPRRTIRHTSYQTNVRGYILAGEQVIEGGFVVQGAVSIKSAERTVRREWEPTFNATRLQVERIVYEMDVDVFKENAEIIIREDV